MIVETIGLRQAEDEGSRQDNVLISGLSQASSSLLSKEVFFLNLHHSPTLVPSSS